jgi:mono/diheme cytochrome c family protein/glucose/arabinose dehydrogenase
MTISHVQAQAPTRIEVTPSSRIVLMGGGLGSRLVHFDYFETGMQVSYPEHRLFIRNIADEGNTPAFRPHSGRKDQLGFPGADKFIGPYLDGGRLAGGEGFADSDEKWLQRLKPDVIIAFFGFSESFSGKAGIDNFKAELDAFVKHTLAQNYNGKGPSRLVLVSPVAFEDVRNMLPLDLPSGQKENGNIAAYTGVMEQVAAANNVLFVNAFAESKKWYEASDKPLTIDGVQLNDAGYLKLSEMLMDRIFGATLTTTSPYFKNVKALVDDKNWLWVNDFKIPNGVHVFGRRHNPFGPANYPFEIEKIREMTAIRDQAVWAAAKGESIDVAALDAKTAPLPPVETNYKPGGKNGQLEFLKGNDAVAALKVPAGYKIEQFASEQEFPNLANPVQIAFDNKGRLWVATMPSYPHWRPGDPRPNDKILIYEDTNNDGKADKEIVWADNLHLPMGFEIASDGVYVSQGINLVLLKDTNGDDKADYSEIVFSGFDDHDTHHAISAFCADPSGAIILEEGVFLRTSVDTPYGPIRGTDGGFFRFDPISRKLERHAQLSIPNPWGVAFDDWGQHFFLHTSGTKVEWMLPGSVRPKYGMASPGSKDLIEPAHRVRPTAGLEFLHSRHFPDEVQGDMLICNNIGFLGIKQHKVSEDGTGYSTKWRQDLLVSSDGNFRPVDLEVAPDGSLYIVDWHNPLIGHMQHNARDPNRDHAHGRIYRITYPGRPLLTPAKIDGAPIPVLLDNLKLPEYRTRYRARRELRERDPQQVLTALQQWVARLDASDSRYSHQMLEALYVTWGLNKVDESLLRRVLSSKDHQARAAAVRVLRYAGDKIPDRVALLKQAAGDTHGRVKLEAIVAASWLNKTDGLAILDAAVATPSASAADEADSKAVKVTNKGQNIQITPPSAAKPTTAFTMTVPGKEKAINLSELEIIVGGKNVASQAKITLSSNFEANQYLAANLTDGKKDKENFAHTAFENNPSVRVEFPSPVSIDHIDIWNRPQYEDRFDGAKIAFFNGKKQTAALTVKLNTPTGAFANDDWIHNTYNTARSYLSNQPVLEEEEKVAVPKHLQGAAKDLFVMGAEVYSRDGHCSTCHQPDGKGLPQAGFPPIAESTWVTGSEERLIKITLNGLYGPIEVNGVKYPGLVPMTPFAGMLNDQEIAAVLTYVRNSFGNKATPITPDKVKQVRAATKDKVGFYTPDEILKLHPLE